MPPPSQPKHRMSEPAKYQRHIDGLRAVAVLSVVLYHYGQQSFSGGFVGVDVFFVISGYLISNLILGEISATGDFSFSRFYIRRIRRLLPALAVTLAASLLCAVALFSPAQFQSYGRSLAAAVFSVSNIQFWLESGYFDADSHLKPLLHTWSLSVEEQFYLFWPALLWVFARHSGPRRQFAVLAIMGALSFALNYFWVSGKFDAEYASTIFYLTPFRIFELVIGAMAVFSTHLLPTNKWLHELTMALGLALIAYSVLSYTDNIVFPYLLALAPCLGALLVIVSRESQFVGWLLTNRVAVGIGLISYSLYLVHWPVLVFYEYYTFSVLGQVEYFALFVLSLVLSVLMYFYVEKPFRKNSPTRTVAVPQRQFVVSSVGAMMIIGLIGFQIGQSDGQTWRNGHALSADQIATGKQRRYRMVMSGCNLHRLDQPQYCKRDRAHQILVIGNSHEADGYNIFSQVYGNNPAVNLITFGSFNSCQVTLNQGVPASLVKDLGCDKRVALLSDKTFLASLDGIIFSSNRPFVQKRTKTWQILGHIRQLYPDIPIIVLGGYLNTHRECTELFNRYGSFSACKVPQHVSYNPFGERELSEVEEFSTFEYHYIDKTRLLCPRETLTSCTVEVNGEPAFYDKHHLSISLARHLGRRVAKVYNSDLLTWGFPAVVPRDPKHKANRKTM